ncbi:hypothetical protein KQI48_15155 [Cellulomonas hominis]|uniref:hypothetical protein n=1 Tax=Cellulomonas hominis TaxID=156981 RepID=UPI001C107C37|nr:hypothetical protein [Cellulomonas hominis]MBU5424005.1 hypothetical protein [Cellulomonas hominis]
MTTTEHTPVTSAPSAADLELSAYWQAGFEDSRQIAWLSAQAVNLRLETAHAQAELALAQARLADAEDRAARQSEAAAALHREILAIRSSRSWRLMAPLRALGRLARRVLGK